MERICKICGNADNHRIHTVREMAFGMRDEFEYFECPGCGCLQITEPPDNLRSFYPDEYYAFSPVQVFTSNPLKRFLKNRRLSYCLSGRGFVGRILAGLYGAPDLPDWISKARLTPDQKILDVGCGSGHLLARLGDEGFTRLTGVDPFIPADIRYDNGVTVLKMGLEQMTRQFDFIMLHHAFEHIADPIACFQAIRDRLSDGGRALIRIPTVSSYAWRTYGPDWFQLDAPRHLFLHSIKSIEILAARTGFTIESIEYDSTAHQFLGSEEYKRDIPHHDPRSYINGLDQSIFEPDQVEEFKRLARDLNEARDGDQICIYMRPTTGVTARPTAPTPPLDTVIS